MALLAHRSGIFILLDEWYILILLAKLLIVYRIQYGMGIAMETCRDTASMKPDAWNACRRDERAPGPNSGDHSDRPVAAAGHHQPPVQRTKRHILDLLRSERANQPLQTMDH